METGKKLIIAASGDIFFAGIMSDLFSVISILEITEIIFTVNASPSHNHS